MNTPIAARINGTLIELLDRHGNRVNSAGATGLASGEYWVSACVNGNLLVATTNRGAVVIWELREYSGPVIVGRR